MTWETAATPLSHLLIALLQLFVLWFVARK